MSSAGLRAVARRIAPKCILRIREHLKWVRIREHYAQLPVAEAFSTTYRSRLWGNIEGEEFFSGVGSREEFGAPYTDWVRRFILERNIGTVVDLGCGDYRVGRQICSAALVTYVGVDIVPDLVAYNQSRFGGERVGFTCMNIIEDQLPDGELCLIRQVLQHLSNKQISRVLTNCAKYPYLIVTEDVYSGARVRPNLDIRHGPDNRLFRRSGVFLDHAPFALRTQNVLEIPCPQTHSVIRTCLIERELTTNQKDGVPDTSGLGSRDQSATV